MEGEADQDDEDQEGGDEIIEYVNPKRAKKRCSCYGLRDVIFFKH